MNGLQSLFLSAVLYSITLTVLSLSWVNVDAGRRRTNGRQDRDSVTEALEYVQAVAAQEGNCSFGPTLDLDYDKERWSTEAAVAVRSANLLTLLSRTGGHIHGQHDGDVDLLHSIVIGNVDNNPTVFGSGIGFDSLIYRDYEIFCPYAHRTPDGSTEVKDLSTNYNYRIHKAVWFYNPYLTFHNYSITSNFTFERNGGLKEPPRIKITDGYWTKPYFDCGGGNVWMVTLSVPFFVPEPSAKHSVNHLSEYLIFG